MFGSLEPIVFIGATDAATAKSFYRDRLGLRLLREEPAQALVFQAGSTLLRVSLVREVAPVQYTVLGWSVEDIQEAVDDLVGRGITFERFPGFDQDERGVSKAPGGTKVACFWDPDGNIVSVAQFVTG